MSQSNLLGASSTSQDSYIELINALWPNLTDVQERRLRHVAQSILVEQTYQPLRAINYREPSASSTSNQLTTPPPFPFPRIPYKHPAPFMDTVSPNVYLDDVQEAFQSLKEQIPVPDASTHYSSGDGQEPVLAPQELRRGDMARLKSILAQKVQELYSIHVGSTKLPRFYEQRNLDPSFPNEHLIASLISTHGVEPAGILLNASAKIVNYFDGITPPLPSDMTEALRNKTRIATILETNLRPRTNHLDIPLHHLRQGETVLGPNQDRLNVPLRHVNRGDLCHIVRNEDIPADELRAIASALPDLDTTEEQLRIWAIHTRPDIELVAKDSESPWAQRILSVEVKAPAVFSEEAVRDVLEIPAECFQNLAFEQQAEAGCIRLREAFHRDFEGDLKGRVFTARGKSVMQKIGQEWKYMAQRGQTWGIVTTGWISVILEIDYNAGSKDGDVVYFYPIYNVDNFVLDSLDDFGSPKKLTFVETFALLAELNLEAGLKENDVFLRLCKKIAEEVGDYLSSQGSQPDSTPRHRPPSQSSPVSTSRAAPSSSIHGQQLGDSAPTDRLASFIGHDEIRQMIERAVGTDEPGLSYVFTRQERLNSIFRAMFEVREGRLEEWYWLRKLDRILKAMYIDPYWMISRQRSSSGFANTSDPIAYLDRDDLSQGPGAGKEGEQTPPYSMATLRDSITI